MISFWNRFEPRCGRRVVVWLSFLLFFAGELFAAGEEAPPAASPAPAATPRPVITTVHQYWELNDEEKKIPHTADLEILVYYYDPVWGLLWGEERGQPVFLNAKLKPLPIKARQRVRIYGDGALTGVGINGLAAKVEVLSEHEAIKPIQGNPVLFDWKRLNSHMVVLDGYVDRQEQITENHLALSLIVEGKKVLGRVWIGDRVPTPQYEGSFISIEGVFLQSTDAAGQLTQIELWNSGPEAIQTRGSLLTDQRFVLPFSTVESLATASPNEVVHLAGIVIEQRAGFSVVLRDGTGQVTMDTMQTDALTPGEMIEAVGYPQVKGISTMLQQAFYRRPPKAVLLPRAKGEVVPGRLRLADQVRALTPEEALVEVPARLTGVVTWAEPNTGQFFLQDSSGGVRVDNAPENVRPVLQQGALVEVTGVTTAEGSTRLVRATHITRGSEVALPAPRPVTLDQALAGVGEAQWVEMSGFLRQFRRDESSVRIDLTTPTGEFSALLPKTADPQRFLNSVVQLRGVVGAVFDGRGRVAGIELRVGSLRDLTIEEPFPKDPFSVAEASIANIGRFGFFQERNRWVRTGGVVTVHLPGRYLSLQDGTETLRVLSRQTLPLAPGDRVEVVGLPGREGGRTVLREAVYRRTQLAATLRPDGLPPGKALQPHLDGRLVQVQGTIIDVSLRAERPRVTVQTDDAIIECVAEGFSPNTPAARSWEIWARAVVTGVYRIEPDEYGQPYSFHLQLRTPEDIRITRPRPWWTTRRALFATGFLAICACGAAAGVIILRRRVREQTQLIRVQMEKEARLEAELERSSRLESLGILAGGIAHDFNNLLTVVVGNITLSLSDSAVAHAAGDLLRDAVRGAMRARDLTQQLLTFARGGDPVRAAVNLADVVREAAEFALHGSKLATEYHFAADLWPADVDRGQIGQVVHNLVLNASQAIPGGGTIRFELDNETVGTGNDLLQPGRYLRLSATDDGPGIAPEHVGRIFDPYFSTKPRSSGLGLATVRSIIKKHGGHIEVHSTVGRGTTFRMWLPAAEKDPEVPAPAPEAAPSAALPVAAAPAPATPTAPAPAAPAAPAQRRVLFMDDEEGIRRVAGTLLRRLGYSFATVEHGQQLLDTYEAARREGKPFDLVIMDLTIPGGMGGKDAMRELLKMDPEVRAIVSSGYSSDPVLADYRKHGFKAMVPKPYNVNDLARTLREVLAGAPQSTENGTPAADSNGRHP